MKKNKASHFDHGLSEAQVEYVMNRFADRDAFFIETIELVETLGTVPCGLHGPIVGDAPVSEADVTYEKRGTRAWKSRLVDRPTKSARTVTVIAGPHEETCESTHVPQHGHQLRMGGCNGTGKIECAGMHAGAAWHEETCGRCNGTGKIKHACIVYTMFGGPLSPRESADIRQEMERLERERGPLLCEQEDRAARDAIYTKIVALREKRTESDAFWSEHALSRV